MVLCALFVLSAYLYFHYDIIYKILDPLTVAKESLYIRFIIWNGLIALILKKPLLGYGLGEKAEIFLRPNTPLYYNAHNAYLQTLYEGGVITLSAILMTLYVVSNKLKQSGDRKLVSIFHIILFSDLVMMLSAIPSWYTWYPVLLISQIAVCTVGLSED